MTDLPPLRTRAPMQAPTVLRLEEAARALRLSTRTVRRLIECGDLRASRVGRVLLIETGAIADLLARTRVGSSTG